MSLDCLYEQLEVGSVRRKMYTSQDRGKGAGQGEVFE